MVRRLAATNFRRLLLSRGAGGILPPLVASSAHSIQSVCNVAAHQEDLSEATASAAMTLLSRYWSGCKRAGRK